MNLKKYLDIPLIKLLGLFYGIIVFITFVKRLYFVFTRSRDGDFDWFNLIFSRTILDWILVMVFMAMVPSMGAKEEPTKCDVQADEGCMYELREHPLYLF